MQEDSSVDVVVSCGLHLLEEGVGYTRPVSEVQTWHSSALDSYDAHVELKALGSLAGSSVPSRAPASLAQGFSHTEVVLEASSPGNCSSEKSTFVCLEEGEEFLV